MAALLPPGTGNLRALRPYACSSWLAAQQQAAFLGAGAACSLSWMPPVGCCGAAALGSLQRMDGKAAGQRRSAQGMWCGSREHDHAGSWGRLACTVAGWLLHFNPRNASHAKPRPLTCPQPHQTAAPR